MIHSLFTAQDRSNYHRDTACIRRDRNQVNMRGGYSGDTPIPSVSLSFIAVLILIAAHHHTRFVQAQPITSYKLDAAPFVAVSSTIPRNFPQNRSEYIWQPLIFLDQIEFNWFNGTSVVSSEQLTCCFGLDGVAANFSAYDSLIPYVFASACGLLTFDPTTEGELEQRFLADGREIPQPDTRLSTLASALFSYGFNYNQLWNITQESIIYATLQSNDVNSTSIFLVRGSLVSFLNVSHPTRYTTLDFELQLHEASGDVVLHVIRLENGTSQDIANPIQFGMIYVSQYTSGLPQATMWMNGEFPTEPVISQTIIFSPVQNSQLCLEGNRGISCADCSYEDCVWCPGSSTCFASDVLNITDVCTDFTWSTPLCPAEGMTNCDDCLQWDNKWCTANGNAFLTRDASSTLCSNQPYWDFPTGHFPYCVSINSTCGNVTCNQQYNLTHADVGTGASAGQCECLAGWAPEFTGPYDTDDATLCSQCDEGNGYYLDDGGVCTECPTVSPAIIAALILLTILITYLLVKLNSHPLIQRMMVPVQNSIVYFQTISLLALIDFHWPLAVKHAFSVFAIIGLSLLRIPSVVCFMTPLQTFTFTVLGPLAIGLLLLICVLFQNEFCLAPIDPRQPVRHLDLSLTMDATTTPRAPSKSRFGRAFISFLLLYYNYLCYTIFERSTQIYFFPSNPDKRDASYVIACCMVGYLLGIPLLFTYLVYRRTHTCCGGRKFVSEIQLPLVARYREGFCQYWESLVVPLWKVLLNAIIVYAASSRTLQIILIAALLLSVVALYTFVKPYSNELNNRVQIWLMCGSMVVLFSGVLFYLAEPNANHAIGRTVMLVCSYVLVMSTMILMVCVIFWVVASVVREYRTEQKSSTGGSQVLDYHSLDDLPGEEKEPSTDNHLPEAHEHEASVNDTGQE